MKIIVTLGPSTNTIESLKKIKQKNIDFVRVNMSHTPINDLEYFISMSKTVGLKFILDTEGSQIRTGALEKENIYFNEYQMLYYRNHFNELKYDIYLFLTIIFYLYWTN